MLDNDASKFVQTLTVTDFKIVLKIMLVANLATILSICINNKPLKPIQNKSIFLKSFTFIRNKIF